MSQPTAMRPALVVSPLRSSSARSTTTVLATERQRPKTSARAEGPAPAHGEGRAERGRDGDQQQRARHGHAADRREVGRGEMQADAEHQQDDADLGELAGKPGIGHEARRERADRDAGDEIADERRQAICWAMKPKQKAKAKQVAMVAISETP